MGQKWTNEEIQIIRDNFNKMSDEELHILIPLHTKCSIECKRRSMRLIRENGNKKYNFKNVIYEIEKRNYNLISTENDFKNAGSKIKYICNKHVDKGVQNTTLGHLLEGKGCIFCGRDKTSKKRKIDLNRIDDKKLAESKGFTYVDTVRKNGKIYISFICNKHKILGIQYMTKYNMERNIKGCKYCSGKQLPEWYIVKMATELNPNIEIISSYINLTTKMKCRCIKHGIETNKTMQEILKGQGCYYCGLEKLSQESFLSINEYQAKIKNKNVTVLKYNGMKNNAIFRCNKCGHVWESSASTMSQTGKQCPNCDRYYTGEKYISLLLNKWGISFKEQFRFQDCIDKRPLPFDFYLPDNNVCIEFDGQQHYIQRKGWTDLYTIQLHDKIKNVYCKKKHIKLIRIPYWEQEDLEYFLFDHLVRYGVLEEITKNIA